VGFELPAVDGVSGELVGLSVAVAVDDGGMMVLAKGGSRSAEQVGGVLRLGTPDEVRTGRRRREGARQDGNEEEEIRRSDPHPWAWPADSVCSEEVGGGG